MMQQPLRLTKTFQYVKKFALLFRQFGTKWLNWKLKFVWAEPSLTSALRNTHISVWMVRGHPCASTGESYPVIFLPSVFLIICVQYFFYFINLICTIYRIKAKQFILKITKVFGGQKRIQLFTLQKIIVLFLLWIWCDQISIGNIL